MQEPGAFYDALAHLREQISPHIRAMAMAYGVLLEDIEDFGLLRYDMMVVAE